MSTHSGRGVPRNRIGGDSGFTLVEILIATTILLIAFSAIMSLMLTTTYMNMRAKEKASLVNEANSYIERVRQMRYDDIGTAASTPPGSLAHYSTTVNGYTIDVTPTVTPFDDPNITMPGYLKKLSIDLRAHSVGTSTSVMNYHTEAIIKKTDSGVNAAAQLATIDRTPSSPSSGTVVYGNLVDIGAQATANGDGVTLTSMNFYCDGVPLKDETSKTAQWSLSSVSYLSPPFWWDTLAVNEDGIPLSADGAHTIKLEVWDSNGKQAWIQWTVIVDNRPPMWPADGWITATAASSTGMNLAWSAAYDGNVPTDHYRVYARKDDSSAVAPESWPLASTTDHYGTSGVFTSTPFSRYLFRVTAIGPPPRSSESTGSSSVIGISRPSVSGSTWRNAGDNKSITTYVTIKETPPNFPYSAATSTLYKSTSASMAASTAVGTTFTGWSPAEFTVETKTGTGWPAATAYYYRVETVLTPSGGSPQTFYSQVVGPNGTAIAASTALATVGW